VTAREDVPEEWRRLGFSGEFVIEAGLNDSSPEAVAAFEARLPDRVPFGTNSDWLALRLNREQNPPTVVLVREWHAAIMDFTRRLPRREEYETTPPPRERPGDIIGFDSATPPKEGT